jgi:hypothetical protein
VGVSPGLASPEAPDEELSTARTQLLKTVSREVDRNHVGSNVLHALDRQPVAQARNDGFYDAERDNRSEREDIEREPVHPLDRARRKDSPQAELMRHRYQYRSVAQKMNDVPRFVGVAASNFAQRCHHHRNQEPKSEEGQRHIWHPPERENLGNRVDAFAHSVADEEQRCVTKEEVQRRFAESAVQRHRSVVANGLVDRRDPCC